MARLRLIFLAALAFAAFTFGRADATLCTIPNVFTNGSTINAAPFNSNFSALQACGNNLDNSQVGSAGFYATNLKPTNGTQATFGGSQVYSFPSGVVITGPVVSQGGYLPPVYDLNGSDPSSGSGTMHIVMGSATTSTGGVVTVNLSGAAVFTAVGSYSVTASAYSNSTDYTVVIHGNTGSSFNLYAYTSGGVATSGVLINYTVVGY